MSTGEHRVLIESIDMEGKGVGRINGKAVFIGGVLPGEEVIVDIYKNKPSFDLAKVVKFISTSGDRVTPACPNFGICGGCSLQHMNFSAQVVSKQKSLIDNLFHIGKVVPENIIPPITDNPWEYRYRARLSSRYVAKKNSVLIGFREKSSTFVTDMDECLILPRHISKLIPDLRQLITKLSIKDRIPQVEVAVGEYVSVFVLRIMDCLADSDKEIVKDFIVNYNNKHTHPIQIWLQPKGPESCYPFLPINMPKLSYKLPNFGIEMPYYPAEFTQINPVINQNMVDLAVGLLDIKPNDEILDFFCGIGNFTLPMATLAKHVAGIEGNSQLVNRAKENADYNNLSGKVSYEAADLLNVDSDWLLSLGKRDKWLIDPPRDGAVELVKSITKCTAPKKIIYVSCNPATLSRDASILVNVHGYKLKNVGILNMFPHTSHVESIAEFILE